MRHYDNGVVHSSLLHQNTVVGHRQLGFGVRVLNVPNPFGGCCEMNVLAQVARQDVDVLGVFFVLKEFDLLLQKILSSLIVIIEAHLISSPSLLRNTLLRRIDLGVAFDVPDPSRRHLKLQIAHLARQRRVSLVDHLRAQRALDVVHRLRLDRDDLSSVVGELAVAFDLAPLKRLLLDGEKAERFRKLRQLLVVHRGRVLLTVLRVNVPVALQAARR